MNDLAWRAGQWTLLGAAVVCLFLVAWLSEGRPTITYVLPDDEEQHVVVSCGPTSWGVSERHTMPMATSGDGRSYYRIVEGEDAYRAAAEEAREAATQQAAEGGGSSAPVTRNSSERIEAHCLRANAHRQHQIVWVLGGGLVLAGAGGYIGLRRRIDASAR